MSVDTSSLRAIQIRRFSLLGSLDQNFKKISETLRIDKAREVSACQHA